MLTKGISVDYCAAQLVVIMLTEVCFCVDDGKTGRILRMEEESEIRMQNSST